MRRMQGSRFAFGPFVLDPDAGTLLRNDVPVAIGYRALKLLAVLVGRSGEILGKAELMDALRIVERGRGGVTHAGGNSSMRVQVNRVTGWRRERGRRR